MIDMWTDGACKGNPGVGGWGVFIKMGEYEKILFGGEKLTTNNRMELLAIIKGLSALTRPCQIRIWTDSQYVQKGMTQWVQAWIKNGWKTADRKPVKNIELWQTLLELSKQHTIEWHWVKAHAGDYGNEKADALANEGVDSILTS